MTAMTAGDLKNRTGDVVRALRRGETVLLLYRGRPLGTIAPIGSNGDRDLTLRPYEEAWEDIEATLASTKPRCATWQAAEARERGRA